SPTLIGSWSSVRGQDTGSLPVKGRAPNSVSATPAPSLPGSQAATIAVASSRWAGSRISGRPDTITMTHRCTAAHTLSTAALSAAESCMSLTGRGTPLSPGSYAHCGPKTSPKPSEYGVSPTTTIPVALPGIGADASWLYVTFPPASWRIPSRIVVPG